MNFLDEHGDTPKADCEAAIAEYQHARNLLTGAVAPTNGEAKPKRTRKRKGMPAAEVKPEATA